MKLTLSMACAMLLVATGAFAQTAPPFALAKCDPEAVAPITFNNVQLTRDVLANGQRLAAGTYQVRITSERPTPAAGQSPMGECWVEFLKSGNLAGREVASVISAEDIASTVNGPAPKPNMTRVDVLKGGEYLRVWINQGGTHYIVNLPLVR